MKLFEEFKEYETLWESADAVDEILWALKDFVFEYDGWSKDSYVDHFNPDSGHYTTSKTYEYDDFEYEVDPVSMFEFLRDDFLPRNSDKIFNAKLAAEYKRLEAACENSDEDIEALELFIARNLETFVEMFYEELKEYYKEAAYEWADENLDYSDSY